ncbi:DUF4910 domain-containing protein [Grimontia hollisae]|uniref:DUF4910 domain-containing protein n=1 Tax=Grimontia hollisae TaxID=673 RepID=UPI0013038067|nr:DUF4910 domain-containing protein [Grimontia hollisae]
MFEINNIGEYMYSLADELFPINRSLTGKGVRMTLSILKRELPDLEINFFLSGDKAFDWVIPKEWDVKSAYVEDIDGNRIIDFKENNLHLVGYSIPIDRYMTIDELNKNLYSLPNQPDAIPYITSYYKKNWGFCLAHNQRQMLLQTPNKIVKVKIDSKHFDGVMNYGELYIKGKSNKEILLSTYICHPSMANNELSGPVNAVALAKYISCRSDNNYSYRVLFLPETIGAISYLSKNHLDLKEKVVAGFILTCMGDEKSYSFMPSKYGNTRVDRIAEYVMNNYVDKYSKYSFSERGSDERQYCSPGIELPIVSIMRSKYAEYNEYHTSLDNMKLISPSGLEGAFDKVSKCIEILETDEIFHCKLLCEPQLGKRGLYPTVSTKDTVNQIMPLRDVLMYSDGSNSLFDIAMITGHDYFEILECSRKLLESDLIERV